MTKRPNNDIEPARRLRRVLRDVLKQEPPHRTAALAADAPRRLPAQGRRMITADELRDARATLGAKWGKPAPLSMTEMGEALGLRGRDPGATVRDYETGKKPISGPISELIKAMLEGYVPEGFR